MILQYILRLLVPSHCPWQDQAMSRACALYLTSEYMWCSVLVPHQPSSVAHLLNRQAAQLFSQNPDQRNRSGLRLHILQQCVSSVQTLHGAETGYLHNHPANSSRCHDLLLARCVRVHNHNFGYTA
jgi:hypothetical protein